MHDLLNSNKTSRRDNIYIIGFKCIDFMVAISGVINFIEDYKLINYNQIIQSNHRRYLIDVNIE